MLKEETCALWVGRGRVTTKKFRIYYWKMLPKISLSGLHMQAAAQEGATAPPALDEVVDLHFVALVNKNDRLVELDGRKSFPIDHGKTSASTLLQVSWS